MDLNTFKCLLRDEVKYWNKKLGRTIGALDGYEIVGRLNELSDLLRMLDKYLDD